MTKPNTNVTITNIVVLLHLQKQNEKNDHDKK